MFPPSRRVQMVALLALKLKSSGEERVVKSFDMLALLLLGLSAGV